MSRTAFGQRRARYALEFGRLDEAGYRDAMSIVVSPGSPIRRGDRVVVKTKRRSDGQGT